MDRELDTPNGWDTSYSTARMQFLLTPTSNLNNLGRNNNLTLQCVTGFAGIQSSEKADNLARKGASRPFTGPEPFCVLRETSIPRGLSHGESR